MSNGLDPDQDRHSVDPDLGPNCLHLRLSADDKERPLARKELIQFLIDLCKVYLIQMYI